MTEEDVDNITPFEEIKIEKPYYDKTIEKKFVICVDTMGQDRILTESEKFYIRNKMRLFKKFWEESDQNALTNSIEYFINQEEEKDKMKKRWNEDYE